MSKFIDEFKTFISRGNVMDMAVGVVIGGAFSAIVTSLVDDVIGPVIGMITGGIDFGNLAIQLGSAKIMIGSFIQAVINFLIIALVLFTVIRTFHKAKELAQGPAAPEEPTTKICPYCKSEIDLHATRCPHCTSELGEDLKA